MISCAGQTNRAVWQKLLGVGMLVLTALTVRCEGEKLPPMEPCRLGYRLTQLAENLCLHVDSVVGAHTTTQCLTFFDMVLQFVAEGAAGGLNVIAVYMAEILRTTGLGDPAFIPHFTPDGMAATAKWMLFTVISYFLFCAVLRLAAILIRRGFWVLKVIVVIYLFSRIVGDPKASSETTVSHLFWLALFMAVWRVATAKTGTDLTSLESRLSRLESKAAVMEKEKKQQ